MTSSTTATWTTWTTTLSANTTVTSTVWMHWTDPPAPQLTDEEIAARHAERVEQRRVKEAAEAAVRARAEETLRAVLDAEQWASWEREKHFELITQSGRRYRIRRGVSGNVRLIEDGAEREALCAHPPTSVQDDDGRHLGRLPMEDVVIAQVLALQTDEEGFRRTANITRMAS